METYISAARKLINHVVAAGDFISPLEQVLYVLGGLDMTYTSLVTNITQQEVYTQFGRSFSKNENP